MIVCFILMKGTLSPVVVLFLNINSKNCPSLQGSLIHSPPSADVLQVERRTSWILLPAQIVLSFPMETKVLRSGRPKQSHLPATYSTKSHQPQISSPKPVFTLQRGRLAKSSDIASFCCRNCSAQIKGKHKNWGKILM